MILAPAPFDDGPRAGRAFLAHRIIGPLHAGPVLSLVQPARRELLVEHLADADAAGLRHPACQLLVQHLAKELLAAARAHQVALRHGIAHRLHELVDEQTFELLRRFPQGLRAAAGCRVDDRLYTTNLGDFHDSPPGPGQERYWSSSSA